MLNFFKKEGAARAEDNLSFDEAKWERDNALSPERAAEKAEARRQAEEAEKAEARQQEARQQEARQQEARQQQQEEEERRRRRRQQQEADVEAWLSLPPSTATGRWAKARPEEAKMKDGNRRVQFEPDVVEYDAGGKKSRKHNKKIRKYRKKSQKKKITSNSRIKKNVKSRKSKKHRKSKKI